MRGKEFDGGQRKTIGRITPAYAGKSDFNKSEKCIGKDHPRLCGEKTPICTNKTEIKGSPPPMRGKASARRRNEDHTRITPAYAGKSENVIRILCVIQDHPRLCGEKFKPLAAAYGGLGSPPPMRGKGECCFVWQQVTGITPAYAGKRRFAHYGERGERDHPRLCGEKDLQRQCGKENLGSPPPMRGKGGGKSNANNQPGITPAYAGKSPPGHRRESGM